MWCRLASRVSPQNIDALLGRADEVVSTSGDKESLHWVGKDFFVSELPEDNNFDLLRLLHLEILAGDLQHGGV